MNVTITCHLSARHPGTVYAQITADDRKDELMVAATLDYCLSAAKECGYTVVNAQDVLMWLHKNANFVGFQANKETK